MYGLGFIVVAITYLLLSVCPQLRWWNVCGTVIWNRWELATRTLVRFGSSRVSGIVSGSALGGRAGIIRSCFDCCRVA